MTMAVVLVCALVFAAAPLVLERRRVGERSTVSKAGQEIRMLSEAGTRAIVVVAGGAVAVLAVGWVILFVLGRVLALLTGLFR